MTGRDHFSDSHDETKKQSKTNNLDFCSVVEAIQGTASQWKALVTVLFIPRRKNKEGGGGAVAGSFFSSLQAAHIRKA